VKIIKKSRCAALKIGRVFHSLCSSGLLLAIERAPESTVCNFENTLCGYMAFVFKMAVTNQFLIRRVHDECFSDESTNRY